ncbi:MAG: multicopper oxidase domain-containing protein [Flavobacteriales bacterium]|nr:multicopper oxidase domain-containing protein [Flavobacteriales bacterium]
MMKALLTSYFVFVFCMVNVFAQNDVNVMLIVRNTGIKILDNGDTIRVFGFAENLGSQPDVPGVTIYANEGDSVHIDLFNVSQGAPHTIHLHGLDVNQQNDGVPQLSFEVEHMDHGYYHFKAPHAGTYLYHCHVESPIHVQAGMYGLVIIRPSDGSNTTWNGGPYYHKELSLFMSEIDTVWHSDSVLNHPYDTSLAVTPAPLPIYNPQFFLVNGSSGQQLIDNSVELNTQAASRNYIRLTNIGYYGNRVILPTALNSKIIASDGRSLPQVEYTDTVYVYPGERYGVLAEADIEFVDSIKIEYFDLNTYAVKGVEYISVNVSGFNSVEEAVNSKNNLSVSPNPYAEKAIITVKIVAESLVSIQIIDVKGRLVKDFENAQKAAGIYTYQISNYIETSGIYFVTLSLDGRVVETQKLIKK